MWNRCQLKELLEVPIRNGLTKPQAVRGQGVKMIGMGELFAHSRIFKMEMDLVPVTDKELANSKIEKEDLLFARQSLALDGAGKCSYVIEVDDCTVFESHLIRVRIDKNKAVPGFVYYYFNSSPGRDSIRSIVEQVAAAGIRGKDLIKLSIPCPDIDEQEAIFKFLNEIDKKIDLNNKICDNLYQQMEAIFNARYLSKLCSQKTNDGWEHVNMSQITTHIKDRAGDEELPVFSIVKTGEMQYSEDYFSKKVYSEDRSMYYVVDEGVFAYNPARVNIGSIAINDMGERGCVSTLYVVLRVVPGYEYFFRFYFRSQAFREETISRASGSVRQYFYYPNFSGVEINIPKVELLKEFNELCDQYFAVIKKYKDQNYKLESTKAELLNSFMLEKCSALPLKEK